MKRTATTLALLEALIVAGVFASTTGLTRAQTQTTKSVQLPTVNPIPRTDNVPFSEPIVRYQQWYEGSQFATKISQPVRFVGMEFLGAVPSGVKFDIEVTLANASTTLSGVFQQNFVSNTLIVLPRTQLASTGATTKLMFTKHWIWDGSSNVVADIRIWGNGTGQKITYAATSTISTLSNCKRQFFIGNADATTANSQGATFHYGLTTNFLYQEGGTYPYGQGCPGGNNITPVGTANAVPLPGLASYTQQLDSAGSGYVAAFVLGVSNTTYNNVPLPIPMSFLGGPNCGLQASVDFVAFTKTVGGGPGTGSAKIPTPIPPVGNIGGVKVYSQWIVFDPASSNGHISATQGLMHVIGS